MLGKVHFIFSGEQSAAATQLNGIIDQLETGNYKIEMTLGGKTAIFYNHMAEGISYAFEPNMFFPGMQDTGFEYRQVFRVLDYNNTTIGQIAYLFDGMGNINSTNIIDWEHSFITEADIIQDPRFAGRDPKEALGPVFNPADLIGMLRGGQATVTNVDGNIVTIVASGMGISMVLTFGDQDFTFLKSIMAQF